MLVNDWPLQEDGTKIPGIPFLAQPLLYSIVWIWARQNPETRMSVFGFFTVPAVYFPWFLLGYREQRSESRTPTHEILQPEPWAQSP